MGTGSSKATMGHSGRVLDLLQTSTIVTYQ
jgi:hypothetical protein